MNLYSISILEGPVCSCKCTLKGHICMQRKSKTGNQQKEYSIWRGVFNLLGEFREGALPNPFEEVWCQPLLPPHQPCLIHSRRSEASLSYSTISLTWSIRGGLRPASRTPPSALPDPFKEVGGQPLLLLHQPYLIHSRRSEDGLSFTFISLTWSIRGDLRPASRTPPSASRCPG